MTRTASLSSIVVLTVVCTSIVTTASAQWIYNGVSAATSSNYMVEPEIATDTFGGAVVLWAENSDGVDPIGELYVQRYTSDGATLWGSGGSLVTTPPGMGFAYRVVPDGEGGAVVAWYDVQGIDILDPVIQRINFLGAKAWGTFPAEISPGTVALAAGEASTDTPANSGHLDLVPLGGGALVAFLQPGVVDVDLFIQKVDASGAIQWGPNGVTVCAAAGSQTRPGIISDGEGGAIVAWIDPRNSTDDIYAQRINFLGTPLWTTNGVAVCTASGPQAEIQMVSDGAGGAMIAWLDRRAPDHDIYAQRLDATGAALWVADGEAIAATTANQNAPAIASDDRGGAYIMWTDTRLVGDLEIYGQRVDPDGNGLWGTDGRRMTYADLYVEPSYRPRSARDGNGGVISAYGLSQSNLRGVRAFNADSTGAVIWDESVADTTTGALKQVTVESNSAIVAWEDRRGGGPYGVYAQKVSMIAADIGDRTPKRPALDVSVFPNPVSATAVIRIVLPIESDVQVDIYDALGRRMKTRGYHALSSGERFIRLEPGADDTATLPSGVYFARVRAAGRVTTRKFVVAR